jgi:hypothetical protein
MRKEIRCSARGPWNSSCVKLAGRHSNRQRVHLASPFCINQQVEDTKRTIYIQASFENANRY